MGWVSCRQAHPVLRTPLRWRGFSSQTMLIILIPNSGSPNSVVNWGKFGSRNCATFETLSYFMEASDRILLSGGETTC
jgi:hypothetical protein